MTLNLTIPKQVHTDFTPRITVMGVGGGGTNAVDNMIAFNLQGVDFVVANTDAQQLMHSKADRRIQLGPHLTQGLGAGANPEIGRAAAEEAADELERHLEGVHMLFITAGMGGGTGTGAAPVIARMARERNILTVGVVTKPFNFEGVRRGRSAESGIDQLQQYVDTLIIIPNQNLFRLANERTGWREAFKMADHVLYMGVRGVTDLIVSPGLVNLDFADIRTVMAEMGKAMMGTGEAEGENRATRAAEAAINNPLLEDTSMSGARGLLINITGGEDMTLFEVDQAANRVREEVDEEANILFGSSIDENANGRMRVSVVATGIDRPAVERPRLVAVGGGLAGTQPSFLHMAPAPNPGGGEPRPLSIVPTAEPAFAPTHAAPTHAPLAYAATAGRHPVRPLSASPAGMPAAPPRPGASPMASPVTAVPMSAPLTERAAPEWQVPSEQAGAAEARPELAATPQPVSSYPAAAHGPAQPPGGTTSPMSSAAPVLGMPSGIPGGMASGMAAGAQSRGLFAEPQPAPSSWGAPVAPQASPSPAPRRGSIFQAVTLAFRRPASSEPARPLQPPAETTAESPHASVRLAGSDELGLDIPAFLRKQTS
ncbi:MAG TPA: cell division protein FtsZ [Acetobacteraceae bacterium]|jgi:cell division protein FtsZ|nr:cell division protein FtsZ [Acetobacteraceae bacterium]